MDVEPKHCKFEVGFFDENESGIVYEPGPGEAETDLLPLAPNGSLAAVLDLLPPFLFFLPPL